MESREKKGLMNLVKKGLVDTQEKERVGRIERAALKHITMCKIDGE